ncbi:AfsR/SARP family transcriptional regulator [Nonomuraea candida]|uniref:AfsR/SARP family transcriptional regulator n=1 Tax=Nonomuraea candida TaxID=359159 RepID=UPI0005B88B63|nr:BTAD domain-containing putative transcriptional regulator [Nonomuraea candida]
MAVELRVLGEIEAAVGGVLVPLGPARQRCVLAVLLADANRPVHTDRLVERVWGEHPPRTARATLRSYVSRLRAALAGAGEEVLAQRAGGYVLVVDEEATDVHRFRRLVRQARATEGEQSLAVWEQAWALWRGEPFAGLDSPWLAETRALWERERFAAQLDYFDVALACGRHAEISGGLSALSADHPLDERVAGQLMLALYRGGHQAQALEHYQRVRGRLVEELGIDPGPSLRRLHQQILTGDPALSASPAAVAAAVGAPARPVAVPRQLPAAPGAFVGRERELSRLTTALRAGAGATVVISAIGGAGGIGKTWLALHWAHRHLERFGDGQLHVNLRGFDPSAQPVPPAAALRGFLDALGVDPQAIPADAEGRAALYRSMVAGKRLLIVLDNARDSDQVLPLLPGSPTCTVLITSRNALTALVAGHGARPVALDVLDLDQSRRLLSGRLGRARIDAEPRAAEDLVRHCAGLPLALGIVAARAAASPALPLAALAGELREAADRLDALDLGEPAANLRAVLSCSFAALPAEVAGVFTRLGLAVGADAGLAAVAALTALPVRRVRLLLRRLESDHLVQQHLPGRYRMHDLIRIYAAEHARSLPEQERRAATRRLVDFYLRTAHAAERVLNSSRPPIELGPAVPGAHPDPPADEPAALAWFEAERSNLLAVQRLAIEQGRHVEVWQLAWSLTSFDYRRGHLYDHLTMWQAGLAATEELGDRAAQALAHRLLGPAYARAEQYAEAAAHLKQALALAERAGDLTGQVSIHHNLAWVWEAEGDDEQAVESVRRALRLSPALGNPVLEAQLLNSLGWLLAKRGEHAEARRHGEKALGLLRRHHHPTAEAATLTTLGWIARLTGRHEQAMAHYRRALAICHEYGDAYEEPRVLEHMGEVHHALGDLSRARHAFEQALERYEAQRRDAEAERALRRLAAL